MTKYETFSKVWYYLDPKGKKVRVLMVKDEKFHLAGTHEVMVRQINNGRYYFIKAKELKKEK